jgi:hypothetical protein
MMPQLSRQAILDAVHQLPPEEQVALAQEIMRALAQDTRREPPPAPKGGSVMDLRGIARTAEPIDEQQLLDESRDERFG